MSRPIRIPKLYKIFLNVYFCGEISQCKTYAKDTQRRTGPPYARRVRPRRADAGDAFAVERIVLCGITAAPPSREIHKTALGAELTVDWSYRASAAECVEELRAEGCAVYAVEQVEGAVPLDRFVPEPGRRYALVFGNEVDGVSQQVADRSDGALEIPQAGTKHSLNVAVSGGVVLWNFFCRIRPKR